MTTYAILPAPETPAGYRVDDVPDQQAVAFARYPSPITFNREPQRYIAREILTVNVERWARSERLDRRDRRRRARASSRGRRGARRVPFETRWEARIAAHPDIPRATVQHAAYSLAAVTMLIFDRRRVT